MSAPNIKRHVTSTRYQLRSSNSLPAPVYSIAHINSVSQAENAHHYHILKLTLQTSVMVFLLPNVAFSQAIIALALLKVMSISARPVPEVRHINHSYPLYIPRITRANCARIHRILRMRDVTLNMFPR
jgi:hypothetical protein